MECIYKKEAPLMQIPALGYKNQQILGLPMPPSWSDHKLAGAPLASIKIVKEGEAIITEAKDEDLEYSATNDNPRWKQFREYC